MRPIIQKNSLKLALFALGCTAMVGLVNELTKDRIKLQEEQQLLSTLHSIIAPERLNNDLYHDCITVNNAALGVQAHTIYRARFNDQPVAVAISATAPDGYNGNIDLLVAINTDGSISGVRTIKHNETPGLGDKIERRKDDWILSFNGQRVRSETDSRWGVAKDGGMFDQFTGATITPRAVVKAVKRTALYFAEHQQQIFEQESACRSE